MGFRSGGGRLRNSQQYLVLVWWKEGKIFNAFLPSSECAVVLEQDVVALLSKPGAGFLRISCQGVEVGGERMTQSILRPFTDWHEVLRCKLSRGRLPFCDNA